jgi:hypothetical protein
MRLAAVLLDLSGHLVVNGPGRLDLARLPTRLMNGFGEFVT